MRTIKYTFWVYGALLSLAWIVSEPWPSQMTFIAWRNVLLQYSGIVGLGAMSLALILAWRPAMLERRLAGLDKMYRLHKWLGIAGLGFSISHWLLANAPKWLSALGWLERKGRRARPQWPEGSWQALFQQQRGLAESVGEWAFYLAALLMVLALIKRFPYRRFVQTHIVLAACYLALVFHAVILLKFDYWASPIGPIMVLLMALGSWAALGLLARHWQTERGLTGTIVGLDTHSRLHTLNVDIAPNSPWPGHAAGQFAFLTFHRDEGAHPFTIASAWQSGATLRFQIKALGDYTQSLAQRLRLGDAVQIDGPYGQFTFQPEGRRQVWISGGIGITPFLARLAQQPPCPAPVDLFHCTRDYDGSYIEDLQNRCDQAHVRLHVYWEARDGRLPLAHILKRVPEWRDAEFWFCGPSGFGDALQQQLQPLGLPTRQFHRELFEMR